MQVFGFKGVKNGYKVKKDILSVQDILLALFGRGGGLSPFGATFLKKVSPQPPTKKYLLVLYYESKLQQFF